MTDPSSVGNLNNENIAYVSCEPGDYAQGAIDANSIINLAAGKTPAAIIFYSNYASKCAFTPGSSSSYSSLYTMITANDSVVVLTGLAKGDPSNPNSKIDVNQNSYNNNKNQGNDNGNVLGKSPTTAVAMIILYSITGIITALFLAIIVVGAVRAHRHPERYGPRRVMGRPRQSRARGIARAMLETLPIIKFGDKDDDKPGDTGRDIELANAAPATGATESNRAGSHSEDQTRRSIEPAVGDGPDVVTTVAATDSDTAPTHKDASDPSNAAENGLACSVCTDDFVKGQDIRVLPCQHKFHPECIDPWLLNVSGTCPLWQVSLSLLNFNHH